MEYYLHASNTHLKQNANCGTSVYLVCV